MTAIRVAVVGGANVDIKGRTSGKIIAGTSNPGTVAITAGGVGRNIAENLARLGRSVTLVTVLGQDANGQMLRDACTSAGIDIGWTVTRSFATGTYLAVIDDAGEMVCAVNDMRSIESLSPADLEIAAPALKVADFLVADCNISAECLQWLCDFSGQHGRRLLIEPVSVAKSQKLLNLVLHQDIFAVTPNDLQLKAMTGEVDDISGVRKLIEMGFQNVVLHRGARGALICEDGRATEVPALAKHEILDVTGAGDAAVAGLVSGLLDGLSLADASRMGQAAAAITLASEGSVSPQLSRATLHRVAGLP